MLAVPRPQTRPSEASGNRIEDVLILASSGAAFLIALATAHQHVPLGQNPHVLLFVGLDAVFVLYLSVALTVCQRRRLLGAALAVVVANGLLAASCIKTLVLGESGFIADVGLMPDLLRVLDPALVWLAVGAVSLLAALFIGNLGVPRSRREAWLVAPLLALLVIVGAIWTSPPIAAAAAGAIPVQARGFPTVGHFYTAYSSFVRDLDWANQMRAIAADGAARPGQAPLSRASIPAFTPRNLHIVVVESLTDPAWYPRFGLEHVQLPPLFERWRQAPRTTALSPVFGNRSSNAEFEVLCGVPSTVGPSEVVFWRLPARPLPCLPRRLAALGYQSISFVPSSARIFNAAPAYAAIGFDRSVFDRDLDMSDRDGEFLSADATLDQHWATIAPLIEADRPLLSYVFINASHYPYARNEQRRPTRLHAPNAPPIFAAYANAIDYVAQAIDRLVARLRARDPDALIVILGDHAPPLGANLLGYRQGGRIARDEERPLTKSALYEVPLLILDRGKLLSVGRLPTYLIPYLALDRLTDGRFCLENGCTWQSPWRLRPFRDFALIAETSGKGEYLCASLRAGSEPCRAAAAEALGWQIELLDLIEGRKQPQAGETVAAEPGGA